jgi:hydrogenase expression/formation protein HypC
MQLVSRSAGALVEGAGEGERTGFPEGEVERDGVRQTVSLLLLPEAAAGDWVLVHAGYAIARVDAQEAAETLAWLHEMMQGEGRKSGDPGQGREAWEAGYPIEAGDSGEAGEAGAGADPGETEDPGEAREPGDLGKGAEAGDPGGRPGR